MDPPVAKEDSSKPLPRMSVDDAMEEISATGNGAWTGWCVLTLASSFLAFAVQIVSNAYVASCTRADFDVSPSLVAMIPSATFSGMAIGSLFLTPLADVIGRKELMTYTSMGMAFFGLLAPFAPTFMLLVSFRFLFGVFQGPWIVPVDLLVEFVPKDRRGIHVNYATNVFFGIGSTLASALAWLIVPHFGWRCLLLAAAIPLMVNAALIWTLVESPRWLVSQGRTDEALKALAYMAEKEGTSLPCSSLEQMASDESTPLSSDSEVESVPGTGGFCWFYSHQQCASYKRLFSDGQRRTMFFLIGAWIFVQASYNMLVLFDGSVLDAAKTELGPCQFDYHFQMLVSSSEIVGGLAVAPLLDTSLFLIGGRRGTQVLAFTIGAATLFLASCSVRHITLWAFLSRGLIKAGCGVMIIQTAESLDVRCRATGTSLLVAISFGACSLASYWVYSGFPKYVVGMGISLTVIIGLLFMLCVPETAGKQLDTPSLKERASNQIRKDRV